MQKATEITELVADIREQVLYLQELGVDTFDVNLPERTVESGELRVESKEPSRPAVAIPEINIPKSKPVEPRLAGSRLAELPSLSKRAAPPTRSPSNETDKTLFGEIAPALLEPTETIEQIRAEIGPDCTRCKLSTLGRKQVVNSTGNFNADLMFCGEAPGADEDEQGFPFVGRAGQLLTKIIESIGLRREDVFIGNINRCRPPGNRAPEPDETLACKPFLKREVAVVRPKVIVVLGATAAQNLLETKVPIGKLRGHFHDYLGVKVMPTFHPAYLLRDPHKKREVWDDMKMVRDYLNSVK
ncbi:MAG: uracil-DNA glycosylase [Acidobacteriota bacterium]